MIAVVTGRPDNREERIRQLWREPFQRLIAPGLIRYEITNALHRLVRATPEERPVLREALQIALALPIELYHESWLHPRAMDFAERFHLPAAYDAHYLALADHFSCELWTADQRLVNTVSHSLPWVRFVGPTF